MGCLRIFMSLRSIPIWLGGACAAPQSKWASPQDLWLWKFIKHPIFKNAILRRQRFFSPERRSKVIKFAKNDPLDALIVLARDEPFLFFPLKTIQRGDHWRNFFAVKPYDFASFSLVFRLFSTEYDYSTSTNQHICPPAQIRPRSSIASADFAKFSNSSSSASFWATEMLFRWKLLRIQPGIHCCAQNLASMPGSETALNSFWVLGVTNELTIITSLE